MAPPDLWARVSEVLSTALDLPESERTGFLAAAIAREPALRTEVMEILGEMRATEGFLEPPAASNEASSSAGERYFGPYRVVGELGEGGMGVVYLAERSDGQFTRRVAIKRVGRAAPGAELLRRFRDERQILARLDHPNIARLLDSGVDGAGVPYLVMELVEGVPLTDYCRSHGLGVRPRLELFLRVCAAVQAAHQGLVVHRDIKPGNILVDAKGEPKLLDFGIARVVGGEGEATLTVNRALTLDYASPEQVRGEPVTTVTDVYSLGVTLYELLAEVKPYEVSTKSLPEAVRVVCDAPLTPPSRIAPLPRRGELAGDLDHIVLRAMEKAPGDRYASVAELLADVAAYLDHRPVRARRQAFGYVARKFVRRHRVGVATAAAATLSLLAGLGVAVYQARVADTERRRAEARFQDVRKLAHSVLYELHDAIAPLQGATPARRVLVARALEYLDRLSVEAPHDLSLQREVADGYRRIALAQGGGGGANLGDTKGALGSYAKALAIRRSLAARQTVDPADELGLALLEFEFGAMQRGLGQIDQAEASYESATARLESLRSRDLLPEGQQQGLAMVYQRLAELHVFRGRLLEALPWARKAVAEAELLWQAKPEDPSTRSLLATALHELASVLAGQDQYKEALDRVRQARDLLEAALRDNPRDVRPTFALLYVLNAEGSYLFRLGDAPGALTVRAHALEVAEAGLQRDLKDRWSLMGVAVAAGALGDLLLQTGQAARAEPHYRNALRIASRAAAEDPQYGFARLQAASAEHGLGRALVSKGTPDGRTEGCAALSRVHAFWAGLQEKGQLPAGEAKELQGLPRWLARCPAPNGAGPRSSAPPPSESSPPNAEGGPGSR